MHFIASTECTYNGTKYIPGCIVMQVGGGEPGDHTGFVLAIMTQVSWRVPFRTEFAPLQVYVATAP